MFQQWRQQHERQVKFQMAMQIVTSVAYRLLYKNAEQIVVTVLKNSI